MQSGFGEGVGETVGKKVEVMVATSPDDSDAVIAPPLDTFNGLVEAILFIEAVALSCATPAALIISVYIDEKKLAKVALFTEVGTSVIYTALAVEGRLTEVVKKSYISSIHVSTTTGAELIIEVREWVSDA